MTIALLILGVVLFIGLVVIHEWGHFIAARRGGVEVEEFGIGFPPRLWKKKVKTGSSKFLFTVNLLPLGGFVRMKGENDADKRPGSFGAAPLATKIKIMLAGVTMNLIVAVGLLMILAWIGMPKLIDNQYTVASDTKVLTTSDVVAGEVVSDSPAARGGMQKDDKIISVAGTLVYERENVGKIAREHAGQNVEVVIERAGQRQNLQVQLNSENTGMGYLGVASQPSGIELRRSTWSAPVVAAGLTKQFTELTFKGIGTIFSSLFKGDTRTASEQVSGPVGIAVILKEGSKLGIHFILFVIAILSLSLAIMNILPIPALDGGRLFVTLLFRALKKPLTADREDWIHGTGFVALILLFVLITIVDVKRFF